MKQLTIIFATLLLISSVQAQEKIDRAFGRLQSQALSYTTGSELLMDSHPVNGELVIVKEVTTYKLPDGRQDMAGQVLQAFDDERPKAYYHLKEEAGGHHRGSSLSVGDKGDFVIVGNDDNASYEVLCFTDDAAPDYRTAYAVEWKEVDDGMVCRAIHTYGVKPNAARAGKRKHTVIALNGGDAFDESSFDGLLERWAEGLDSLGSLGNMEPLERLRNLGDILVLQGDNEDEENADDVTWLMSFNHYRKAFLRTVKTGSGASSAYATRLLKLCKQARANKDLLSANERKLCVKSLKEMSRETNDSFVRGLIDEARAQIDW